jgi:hypothetical protein
MWDTFIALSYIDLLAHVHCLTKRVLAASTRIKTMEEPISNFLVSVLKDLLGFLKSILASIVEQPKQASDFPFRKVGMNRGSAVTNRVW